MADFSHLDEQGRARMVDVSEKKVTERRARASVQVRMQKSTLAAILSHKMKKGNVLEVARLAGIMAAKRTDELIPLCHQLPLDGVSIEFEPDEASGVLTIVVESKATAKTGVEMEALTGASITALTVYDMCKAVDREMIIDRLMLVEKTGGKSDYLRG